MTKVSAIYLLVVSFWAVGMVVRYVLLYNSLIKSTSG